MNFQKKKLKNGITVMHEYRDLPIVSCSISNPFAAAHETAEIKGVAHFIEHLLFTGTKNRTHEDISREIEKKGGVLNAFTAQDITSYWFKLPEEHLFAGLDILVDMLKNPSFNEEKFEKEKKVVLEEIKMYHDMPQRHVFEQIEANLYDEPFGKGIAGSAETVNGLTRDFVASYFKEKYAASNYIVTVVGKADFDKVCEYFEKQFDEEQKELHPIEVKIKHAKTVEERPGIDQAHLVFAIHAPLATEKEKYVLDVLDAYLANGMSSRLFLEIREKRGLAYSVNSGIHIEKNYSYYSIYVGTTKEDIDEVEKLIAQGFDNVESEMKEKDLEEAKERINGLRKVSGEESVNVMNELVFTEVSTGDAENYYNYENEINAVTLEQVKALAKKLRSEYSTAAIIPK